MTLTFTDEPIRVLIFLAIYIATLVHVYRESKRLNDAPVRNTLLVALCFWPLPYFFWLFYWPGTLWKKLTGQIRIESI